jgi:hypothetical protein
VRKWLHPRGRLGMLDQGHWWLRTRCGECGRSRDFVVDRSQAEAFEESMRAAELEIRTQADWWALQRNDGVG